MFKYNKELMDSIYNKRTEIHYNEWTVKHDKVINKVELKGKIKCPLLNTNISSLVCVKLMDKQDWPRNIDNQVCKKCGCFINLSISKFQNAKLKDLPDGKNKNE